MEPRSPSSKRPSSGKVKPGAAASATAPRYHHYTPDVSRNRPSTASRSKFVGQYKQLNRLVDKPGFVDETQKTMEFLVCAQHLDNTLSQRQMTEKPSVDGLPPKANGRPASGRHRVGDNLDDDDDDNLDTPRGPMVQRRREIDILTRRTQTQEAQIARKLGILMKGEQRRADAEHTRVSRPLVERDLKRSLTWLKLVHTVRPAILLGEQLREHQARSTLQSLFSVQIMRFLKRRRERIARRKWMAGRVEKMVRPSPQQVAKAVPVMKHFPREAMEELLEQMVPHCFKQKEYMSYTPSIKDAAKAAGMLPMGDTGGGGPSAASAATPLEGEKGNVNPSANDKSNTKGMIHFIDSGVVDVFYTNLGSHGSHGRAKKIIERLSAGQAVGVEALLMTEARKHIAVCKSEVNSWALPVSALFAQIEKCSASVQQLFNEIAEDRRREMMRLQPLTEALVRQASSFFNEWGTPGIAKIIRVLDPIVLNKGRECSKGVYFVVHGRLDVITRGSTKGAGGGAGGGGHHTTVGGGPGVIEVVKSGQAYGELQSYFPDDRRVKIVAATTTDAWFLRRADLLEYAAHENVSSLIPLLERAMNRPTATSGHHHGVSGAQSGATSSAALADLAGAMSNNRSRNF